MPSPLQTAEIPDADDGAFTVSSSLPPMVTGALAGEMELSVPCFFAKPGTLRPSRYLRERQHGRSPLCAVRIQWWGDVGPGTVLKPDLSDMLDEKGQRARSAGLSSATCALFPVRCGLEGLVAYLKDMRHIALDVLIHEGDTRGARQIGRCVFPVSSWDGQHRARADGHERNVVAEGCFPVLSVKDSKHVGDLRVRLRACLGPSSRLRRMLEAAQSSVGETRIVGDSSHAMKARGEIRLGDKPDGAEIAKQAQEVTAGETWQQPAVDRPQRLLAGGGGAPGLPVRRSFDSDDLSSISSVGAPAKRLPPDAAPLSSFQLNEALAKFDVSGALPVWPTPKSSLYRSPETHGEVPPTPRHSDGGRGGRSGRLASSAQFSAARKKSKMSRLAVDGDPRGALHRSDAGVRVRAQAPARGQEVTAEQESREAEERFRTVLAKSVSPERQAPGATPTPLSSRPDPTSQAENTLSSADKAVSPHVRATAVPVAIDGRDMDGACLAQLLDRGNELRKKMVHLVETIHRTAANVPMTDDSKQDVYTVANPPPELQMDQFADMSRPGLMSSARLGSSLRDDIEGIFDTLSDNDMPIEDIGVPIRDPEVRENEDRVVDLLLAAAGPPPSSLAFPVLAEVERRRADSLSQVRFLRIRMTRVVMFGSMTSAPEGHGWQLRFRLPAFTMSPGRGKYAEGSFRTSTKKGENGSDMPATRVISLPVPARAPKSSLDRSSRARGGVVRKSKAGNTGSTAGSMLRVRRGYGAADMVVGETPLLEEVVCAVNVNDACVRHWMDAAVEFLLVDGRSDGVRSSPPNRPRKQNLEQNQSGAAKFSSTVGPGDRVAAVATLPLRDLVLSAELALASTLDLTEVVDFWAAEDARAAAAGRRRQGGRPLRNPYRSDSATAARPLVLGDRAVGALAVGMELLPGESPASPEHSGLPEREAVHVSEVRRGRSGSTGGKNERRTVLGGDKASLGSGCGGAEPHSSDESVFEVAASVDKEKGKESPSHFPPLHALPRVDGGAAEAGAEEVALAGERKTEAGHEAKDKARWGTTPHEKGASPCEGFGGCVEGENEGVGVARRGPLDVVENGSAEEGFATILRLDGLRLASATASASVAHVRVAYSFTQTEGHSAGTVMHRSVRGFRRLLPTADESQPSPMFILQHEEIVPAPSRGDSSPPAGQLSATTSRVFEVWRIATSTTSDINSSALDRADGKGHTFGTAENNNENEDLLGLAKISLAPSSELISGSSSDGGGGDGGSGGPGPESLAIVTDGPVSVVDPFSGRAVGELTVFFAVGPASAVAGLAGGGADDKGNTVDGAPTACGVKVDAKGPAPAMSMNSEGQREERLLGGTEGRKRGPGKMDDAHGRDGAVDAVDAVDADDGESLPLLDDSVSELSMLLNPGRPPVEAKTRKSPPGSGGFAGLVRHVVELCAVGELPITLGAGEAEEGRNDAPIGCAIEYSLPAFGHASLGVQVEEPRSRSDSAAAVNHHHELWWDADSGILNSRARHSIKVPGGMLDSGYNPESSRQSLDDCTGSPQTESLNRLLDCMFGKGDLQFSLFWNAGDTGSTAGQRKQPQQPSWDITAAALTQEETSLEDSHKSQRQKRRFMGTAWLRRVDMLPLVRRTSGRAVLSLPIEPPSRSVEESRSLDCSDGGDDGDDISSVLSAPVTVPLSISYRREPSAVARRKSRGWSGGRHKTNEKGDTQVEHDIGSGGVGHGGGGGGGGDRRKRGERELLQDVDELFRDSKDDVILGDDCHTADGLEADLGVGLHRADGEGAIKHPAASESGEDAHLQGGSRGAGDGRAYQSENFGAGDSLDSRSDANVSSSSSSSSSSGSSCALVHRSSKTEHLLPAHTTVCVCVDTLDWMPLLGESAVAAAESKNSVDDEDDGDDEDDDDSLAYWASFTFPSSHSWENKRDEAGHGKAWGGDYGRNGRDERKYWSRAVSAVKPGDVRHVTLGWCVEIPVTIDAAFVRFVHTQSLAVQIWRGRARAWPRGGLCAGVARVELRSLLITLGGVGGNVSITSPPGNGDGLATGSIAVRLFFKHRGLGSSGEAPNDLGHENTVSEQERLPLQRRELQTEKFGGKQGLLLEAGAGGQSAEEKGASRITLDSGRTDLGTVFHTENVMGHSGTVTDGRTDSITCSDTAAPRAEGRLSLASMEFPVRGPVEVVPAGAAAESRTTWTLRQAEVTPLLQRPGSMPTGGGRDGGELRVVVERAMRLPLLPSSGIQRGGAVYGPTAESLPSTYVTFRWEEGGKPPVRSPFVSCSDGEVACTGGPDAASNGSEAWPVEEKNEGEGTTPTIQNTQNPIFAHTTVLPVATPNSWEQVCGSSAALVFRVWQRLSCTWWGATPAEEEDARGQVVLDASRFGDKLIGSAVVGLDILRGSGGGGGREGQGLHEIDGWYHVLDELQRSQGQLKVRVQPQPAAPAREESQNLMLSGQGQPYFDTHTTTDTDDERVPSLRVPHQPLRDAAPTDPGSGEPSSERSRVGAAMSTETGETPPSTPTAPLHDTQTHLRAVHALLDSLPPEYRSDVKQQQQRRQQRPPPVSSGPVLKPRYPRGHFPTATVAHPLPSEEPLAERLEPDCEGAMYGKRATLHYSISGSRDVGESSACGRDDTGVGGGGEEPSSLPEIRRLLSSLDRVDRRLLNLASPGGDTCGEVRSSGKDARTAGGDGIYNYEASRNVPMLRDPLAEGERSSCSGGETGLVDDSRPRFADGADEQAATKIQGAWRTASMRRRRKAASLAQQEALRAASRRERARTESARTIQVAYRRAQARHRARAELEERRRWTDRQRRREAAYLTLARAWRAFECRRRGKRELAEARARVAAAAAAAAEHARKVDQAARAAIVIQKLLRGGLSRQAARRLRGARRHSGSGGNSDSRDAWSVGTRLSSSGSTATESSSNTNGNGENGELTGRVPDESVLLRATTGAHAARPMLSKPSSMASTTHCVVATPSAARTSPKNTTAPAAPRPLPPPPPSAPAPSTFYNQLSQDPRRRYPIPEAHVASAPSSALAKSLSSTEVAIAESRGVAVRSQRFGPPPADSAGRRVVGVMRPPRFADLETARIARIMKGNLQHWAGVRSSGGECSYSSSDDFDL